MPSETIPPRRRVRRTLMAAALALPVSATVAAAQTIETPPPVVTTPPPAVTPEAPVATAPSTGVATAPSASTTATSPATARNAPLATPSSPSAAARVVDPYAPTARRTWSGRVVMKTVARSTPGTRSKVVARVSPYGPYDRDPQYLMVLESKHANGGVWYRVLLPTRPNGSSGWVSENALQLKATPMRLRVDLSDRTLTLLSAGRQVWTRPVAVGTTANPTPTGLFAISEIVPQRRANGFFGPFIITLTAHSENLSDFDGGRGQVAVHGTSLPGLLGRAVSHGCVRISNKDVREIARRVPRGAPVEIVD